MAKILKGRTNISDLPDFRAEGTGRDILDLIQIGNSKEVQSTETLNNILSKLEMEKGVQAGAKLPIEHYNVYFQEGGLETASVEMKKYIEEFSFKKSMGMNVMGFDYSQEDELEAENTGINLDAEAVDKVAKITTAYNQNYLPYARLTALLTGCSLTEKIPGDGASRKYSDAFGVLRGEDVSDWLLPTATDKKRNHYRTIKGRAIADSDIQTCISYIASYKTYSKRGIVALASPSKIYQILGASYTAPTNVDDVIVNRQIPVAQPFGCEWIAVPELEGHDFIIFLDKGRYDILFRRVEPSERQRGLGLVMKDTVVEFKHVTDIKGAKLRIFPEEWYLVAREAVVILDTNSERSNSDGTMQTNSITALEGLAKLCLGAYNAKYVK